MPAARNIRIIVVAVLLSAIVAATALLFFTSRGQALMQDPHAIGPDAAHWVRHHPTSAVTLLLGSYMLLSLLALPVWFLQMLSGYVLSHLLGVGWGLASAVLLCQCAATASAAITFYFSRWLAGDWFHAKVEARMARLRELDNKLGHNGFLVVMAVRLIHVMPFAISNYAFGLISITAMDVIIGTFLGGIPGTLLYVTSGAHARLLRDWRFVGATLLLNLLLMIPIALRYLRPGWFRKMGVE